MTFFLSQKNTEEQNTQHSKQVVAPHPSPAGPSPVPSWPLPPPLPKREGRDHRDTPMGWMWANCCPLFVPTLAVTLCELCMPEAFCELEMCAKNLRELCALCERKTSTKYASRPVGVTSHITPLSIRRGAGGEASVSSVRERTNQEPYKLPSKGNLTYKK